MCHELPSASHDDSTARRHDFSVLFLPAMSPSTAVRSANPATARRWARTAAPSSLARGSARPIGSSKPSASDISSTFGRSDRSLSPNRSRNSRVVAYMNGRPTTCLRPTVLIRRRSTRVDEDAAAAGDAADLGDLGGGDRLLVGNDRERLERLHRQLAASCARETACGPIRETPDASRSGSRRRSRPAAGRRGALVVGRGPRRAPRRRPPSAHRRAACRASFASPARATRR